MLFPTLPFLVFFLVLLGALLLSKQRGYRKLLLLVASYVFYMCWNPAFILLIVFSTVVDYFVGQRLGRTEAIGKRRALLLLSIAANLGMLAFFKYANFFTDNALFVAQRFGYQPTWTDLNIILPVGISFYTFQTMSYTIDVYRKALPVCRSPVDFALFVSFFPQLVAGPIVRASEFLPQLKEDVKLRFQRSDFFLIVRGLVKKVIVADNIGPFVDAVFESPEYWPGSIIVFATVCFAIQIYCDFSGYSDMAIGLGRILGFRLPMNFNRPYFATNPSDFWSRWHISLSTWLRDYLYIPLGGSRRGTWMTRRNLLLTMLLGGLWHGPSWNFVVWGGLHGAALVVHRAYREIVPKGSLRPTLVSRRFYAFCSFVLMQYFVLLTWIPFRVVNTQPMLASLEKFVFFDFDFRLANIGLGKIAFFSTVTIVVVFSLLHVFSAWLGGIDEKLAKAPLWVGAIACVLIGIVLLLFWPTKETPFIYFQF